MGSTVNGPEQCGILGLADFERCGDYFFLRGKAFILHPGCFSKIPFPSSQDPEEALITRTGLTGLQLCRNLMDSLTNTGKGS